MNLHELALKEAKKRTTDDGMAQLLAEYFVKGYKQAVWDTSEKAIKALVHERNKQIQAGG